jgi:hypothetical protein
MYIDTTRTQRIEHRSTRIQRHLALARIAAKHYGHATELGDVSDNTA